MIAAMQINRTAAARPFLKWAGGKTQLIDELDSHLPAAIRTDHIKSYYEPFLGGGAVFFHLIQKYKLSRVVLSDINRELILIYQVIQKDVFSLIEALHQYEKEYTERGETEQCSYYYGIREDVNRQRFDFNYQKYTKDWIPRAASLIFLNKTCYNGLFRLNKQGGFNVPFGRYKKPKLLDEENLERTARLLQRVELINADFSFLLKEEADSSLVYFDPPYRPVSKTASFTAYSSFAFNDQEQIRLATIFRTLAEKGFNLMLSNSAPEKASGEDNFLTELYKGFQIHRVSAARLINSKAEKRGRVEEILVTNY